MAQFHCALQHTNLEPLRLFISLNLAIAYIKIGSSKESEVRKWIVTVIWDMVIMVHVILYLQLSALVSSIQPDQESL